MGCGVSRPSSSWPTSQLERDKDDHAVQYLELQPCNIPEFDTVFTRIEEVLNSLIGLNNDVNDRFANVKAAYSRATSSWEFLPDVDVPDADIVLLDLLNKNGQGKPEHEDVARTLNSDAKMQSLDQELESARQCLHQALLKWGSYVPLKMEGGILASEPEVPEVIAFNTAMENLQRALDSDYKLRCCVKPAAAYKVPTIRAKLSKWIVDGASGAKHRSPVALLELLANPVGRTIKDAEFALVERAHALTAKTKDIAFMQWQILDWHKVTMTVAIPDAQQRMEVKALLVEANAVMFKIMNSASSAHGESSLSAAVVEIIRSILLMIVSKFQTTGLPYSLKTLVNVNPVVTFKDQGFFDFNLNLAISEAAAIPHFPDCLTHETRELWQELETLVLKVSAALAQMPGLSRDVDTLVEQAREFYELAPEAAARHGLTMMEAVKAAKATGANLKLLFETHYLFAALSNNIKRVADDLARASSEMQKLFSEVSRKHAASAMA